LSTTVDAIKELRQRTGAAIVDCKAALIQADGDIERACEHLRERGFAIADKKAGRATGNGIIDSYIHTGKRVGALVEVNCETDFVARTDQFQQLAHDIAMQVAAMEPLYTSSQDIPEGTDIDPACACLMQQPFIKDPSKTIEELVKEVIAAVGENIQVRRFARFEVGN
jgi:elongation factor Ts